MSTDVLLQTEGLGVSFGGVHAVRNVDFRLAHGEVRCLIGPNGAGKSTFFKMLSGQLRPSRGRIIFKGQALQGLDTYQVARLGIGIKMQVPSIFEGLTVIENLRLAAARRRPVQSDTLIADEVLNQIDLQAHAQTPVNALAHGQRQWVELGMILASRPELVLLDEPAAGMTHSEVRKTAALIGSINRHSTVVVVEHDMAFIRLIASRITVFNQGEVLAEGSYDEIMAHPEVRTAYLGSKEKHMLDANNLHAGYGRISILRGMSFDIAPGTFTGILGRNGMGKTTLLRTLMGELPLSEGSITLEGTDLGRLPTHQRVRHGMGFVPQGRQIFPALTVTENLRMGCVKDLRGAKHKMEEVLQAFPRLKALLARAGGSLSGGEQQLLALARCLCGNPKMMLLDEPTEGIQPSICDEIIETLQDLRASQGIAILLVEQDVDFLRALSDRILVLEKGALIADFVPSSLSSQEIAQRYCGLQA